MMKIYCKKISEILYVNKYSIYIYYKKNFHKLQFLTSIQIIENAIKFIIVFNYKIN